MTPKQFYQSVDRVRLEEVCEAARTTVANFKQIARASGSVGKSLAERLARASDGQMTELEILYPERYQLEKDVAA